MNDCPHCGTSKVERNGYCATYNREQRKTESTKPKVVKPVKKVTDKRAKQNQEYARLRREYLEAYPACKIPECNNKSTTIHHMAGRDGDKLTDVNNFLATCMDCHTKIHENPQWAYKNGYSILRSLKD